MKLSDFGALNIRRDDILKFFRENAFKESGYDQKKTGNPPMIGYLEGKLLKKYEDRILLLANQIGYEVLLPPIAMERIPNNANDAVSVYIYYHQTERQPKPILIGFNNEQEKEFFQLFISVEDIGPLKAVKALNLPVKDIAAAIEDNDMVKLQQMKGIGARTANKMIATLRGKLTKFISVHDDFPSVSLFADQTSAQVLDVLTTQLGYKPADAKRMISEALKRNRMISAPEEMLEELFRGDQK